MKRLRQIPLNGWSDTQGIMMRRPWRFRGCLHCLTVAALLQSTKLRRTFDVHRKGSRRASVSNLVVLWLRQIDSLRDQVPKNLKAET